MRKPRETCRRSHVSEDGTGPSPRKLIQRWGGTGQRGTDTRVLCLPRTLASHERVAPGVGSSGVCARLVRLPVIHEPISTHMHTPCARSRLICAPSLDHHWDLRPHLRRRKSLLLRKSQSRLPLARFFRPILWTQKMHFVNGQKTTPHSSWASTDVSYQCHG